MTPTPGPERAPSEIRLFAKCRNELARLPTFLQHYRRLGVARFFIVDNDSTDGSTEFLKGQPDVHTFQTAERFSSAQGGTTWLNALLHQFGVGSWCVTVDIDELLMYPGSESTPLRTLTQHLDRQGSEALSCLLLDLYPPGRLRDSRQTAGEDLLRAQLYFDPSPYPAKSIRAYPGVLIRGGVRERVFYPEFRQRGLATKIYDGVMNQVTRMPLLRRARWIAARRPPTPPCLTKVPLVRWDEGTRYVNCNHWVSRKTIAAETGLLLHLKLLNDFHTRAVQEAARGEYYDGAAEYRRYAAILAANPDLTLMYDASTRFESSDQLVRMGLMTDTGAWAAARSAERRSDRRE